MARGFVFKVDTGEECLGCLDFERAAIDFVGRFIAFGRDFDSVCAGFELTEDESAVIFVVGDVCVDYVAVFEQLDGSVVDGQECVGTR